MGINIYEKLSYIANISLISKKENSTDRYYAISQGIYLLDFLK